MGTLTSRTHLNLCKNTVKGRSDGKEAWIKKLAGESSRSPCLQAPSRQQVLKVHMHGHCIAVGGVMGVCRAPGVLVAEKCGVRKNLFLTFPRPTRQFNAPNLEKYFWHISLRRVRLLCVLESNFSASQII